MWALHGPWRPPRVLCGYLDPPLSPVGCPPAACWAAACARCGWTPMRWPISPWPTPVSVEAPGEGPRRCAAAGTACQRLGRLETRPTGSDSAAAGVISGWKAQQGRPQRGRGEAALRRAAAAAGGRRSAGRTHGGRRACLTSPCAVGARAPPPAARRPERAEAGEGRLHHPQAGEDPLARPRAGLGRGQGQGPAHRLRCARPARPACSALLRLSGSGACRPGYAAAAAQPGVCSACAAGWLRGSRRGGGSGAAEQLAGHQPRLQPGAAGSERRLDLAMVYGGSTRRELRSRVAPRAAAAPGGCSQRCKGRRGSLEALPLAQHSSSSRCSSSGRSPAAQRTAAGCTARWQASQRPTRPARPAPPAAQASAAVPARRACPARSSGSAACACCAACSRSTGTARRLTSTCTTSST